MLSDFAAHQERRGLLASSIKRRDSDLRKFARWLEPRSLVDATTEDVNLFIGSRDWNARTSYAFLSHLHTFYLWAIRNGFTLDDPTADVDRPKMRVGLPRPVTDDDLCLLISQASPTMRAWIVLGAFAGLRCAEIAGLHREDVIESEGYLRVMGKGRKERIVPIHPLVTEHLRAAGLPRRGPLFRTQSGAQVQPYRVSQQIGAFMRSCSVDASAHQLRHWFGTRSYQACQDVLAVGALMGHANPATTAVYAQFSDRVARTAVLALSLR